MTKPDATEEEIAEAESGLTKYRMNHTPLSDRDYDQNMRLRYAKYLGIKRGITLERARVCKELRNRADARVFVIDDGEKGESLIRYVDFLDDLREIGGA